MGDDPTINMKNNTSDLEMAMQAKDQSIHNAIHTTAFVGNNHLEDDFFESEPMLFESEDVNLNGNGDFFEEESLFFEETPGFFEEDTSVQNDNIDFFQEPIINNNADFDVQNDQNVFDAKLEMGKSLEEIGAFQTEANLFGNIEQDKNKKDDSSEFEANLLTMEMREEEMREILEVLKDSFQKLQEREARLIKREHILQQEYEELRKLTVQIKDADAMSSTVRKHVLDGESVSNKKLGGPISEE